MNEQTNEFSEWINKQMHSMNEQMNSLNEWTNELINTWIN